MASRVVNAPTRFRRKPVAAHLPRRRVLLGRLADVILLIEMSILPILHFPDQRLRETSRNVTSFDDELRRLVADMTDTMYLAEGAGLAAIQVGTALRLFIIDPEVAGRQATEPPMVFINPEIVRLSDEAQTGDEGCLSFPGIFVPVKRAMTAEVKAFDVEGKPFTVEGSGLFARAMQHEHDHLAGRLLIDMVGPVKRQIIKRKMRKEAEVEAT
jgi:peptide deformylase